MGKSCQCYVIPVDSGDTMNNVVIVIGTSTHTTILNDTMKNKDTY